MTQTEKREHIALQKVLKLVGVAETGGHAKRLIQAGAVKVNGAVETRRRKKLYVGDTVEIDGEIYEIGVE